MQIQAVGAQALLQRAKAEIGRILFTDLEQLLQQTREGVVRALLVMRGAAAAEPRDPMALASLHQQMQEPGLADAGLPGQQDRLAGALAGALQPLEQRAQHLVAAHGRRETAGQGDVEAATGPGLAQRPIEDHLAALQGTGPDRLALEEAPHQPVGRVAQSHRVGIGTLLDGGRDVRREPERQLLASRADAHAARRDLARVNAQAYGDLGHFFGVPIANLALYDPHDSESCVDRPPRAILLGLGIAEVHQQTVAQVLGHVPAVTLDGLFAGLVVALEQLAILLWVELGGQPGRAHDVAEHHGDLSKLGVIRGRRGSKRGSTLTAELEARRNLDPTLRTCHRGPRARIIPRWAASLNSRGWSSVAIGPDSGQYRDRRSHVRALERRLPERDAPRG